jgi:hypothetical protein
VFYCSQHARHQEQHARELSTKKPRPLGETCDARESGSINHGKGAGWAADDAAEVPMAALMLACISTTLGLPPFT